MLRTFLKQFSGRLRLKVMKKPKTDFMKSSKHAKATQSDADLTSYKMSKLF